MAPKKGQYFQAHALYKMKAQGTPGLSYSLIAAELSCSKAAVSQFFNHGIIPKTKPDFLERIERFLLDQGVIDTPESASTAKSKYWEDNEKMRNDKRIERQALMPDALDHWGLDWDPFYEKEQPFISKEFRRVVGRVVHCIGSNIFTAVIGEVGAGKTTLLQHVKDHVAAEMPHVILAEVAPNDAQEIQAKHIRDAIQEAIGGDLQGGRQKRATQFRKNLEALRERGKIINVVIDDAQWLAPKMFGQLKLFAEMEQGYRRLIGITLIGQDPELDWRLDAIRSAGWRVTRTRFHSLGEKPHCETAAFIKQRLTVAGARPYGIMEPATLKRLCELMEQRKLDYPLPLSALMSLMLTKAHDLGLPKVPKEMVEDFFTPPGRNIKPTAKQKDMEKISPELGGSTGRAENQGRSGQKDRQAVA